MSPVDPQFPNSQADLVTEGKKAAPWWYEWFRKVNSRLVTAETTAQAATDAVAAIPEPVPSPNIIGLDPIQVFGSPDTSWTVTFAGDTGQDSAPVWMGDEPVMLDPFPVSAAPPLPLDTDGTLAANSDYLIATQKATKTYVDASIAGGGAVSAGSIINSAFTASATVASNASTTIPFDNTIPQNTEGDAYASLDTSITPYFSGSILDVEVYFPSVSGSGTIDLTFALFRDSTADALASVVVTIDASNYSRSATLRAQVSAGSTSATTFKVRWGRSGSTGYINRISSTADIHGGILKATMTIREIKQ